MSSSSFACATVDPSQVAQSSRRRIAGIWSVVLSSSASSGFCRHGHERATLDNVVILSYRALPEHRNSKHETVDYAARSTVGGIRQG